MGIFIVTCWWMYIFVMEREFFCRMRVGNITMHHGMSVVVLCKTNKTSFSSLIASDSSINHYKKKNHTTLV